MSDLDRNTILEAEFNYVAQMVFQNQEDRANATTFYLTAFGSFIVAIVSASREGLDGDYINLAFCGLFVVVGLIGVRTLVQLVLLRKAWFDSVITMNRIKRYYIEKDGDLGTAFNWLTLPPGFKVLSVSFLMALQTAVLSSAAFGVAVVFFVRHVNGNFTGSREWLGTVLLAVAALIIQLACYTWSLSGIEQETDEAKQPADDGASRALEG
jgi:hypothetical protein